MSDPVEALAAALAGHTDPKDGRIVPPLVEDEAVRGGWRYAGPNEFAAELLRASGFDVVPTGDAGLDVKRLRKAMPEWFGQVPDWALFEWAAEYARLSSSDTDPLDVERLADALHEEQQCDFGYCEGRIDHIDKARAIAAEYARLSSSDTGGRG